MEPVISLREVGKSYARDGRNTVAIENISLSVARGEYLCVLGRSGCGKSTAIQLLLGLNRPTRGEVKVLGVDPHEAFDTLKGKIACIFQSDRLLPWRSTIDNVRLPLEILGLDHTELWRKAPLWLERFGLAGFEHAHPSELSGGMRQRVALARALASEPEILLADEAFGHLDAATGDRLRREFKMVARQGGKTVLHVTHSIDEALELADRIVVLGRPGRVLATFQDLANRDPITSDGLRSEILSYLKQGGWSDDEVEELTAH